MPELSAHPALYMLTLGCPKNRVDSEVMLGCLQEKGFQLVGNPAQAEVILINSCAFIGEAKQESIDAILEHAKYKEEGSCKALVVAGCLTQRYAEVLAQELPEVDHFVGTGAYHRVAEVLRGARDRAVVPDPHFVHDAATPRRNSMPSHTAYVKISEGCDNRCAFCIIPKLRGAQRSRPIGDIVREAELLANQGAMELNLVAQDLTAYGHDLPGRPRLHELLRRLAKVPVRWIRLHYAYPRDFPDPLIGALAEEERIVKYLDMPLQHASDRMLRAMRRGRGRVFMESLLARLRERIPGLVLRTSFIVGFPGETDEDFEELCKFVEDQKFDKVGVFRFSREEGTASFDLPGQLPERVKSARHQRLMQLQRRISREKQRALLGKIIPVLVEGVSEETELLLEGRWWGQAPEVDGKVYVNRGTARPGSIVPVRVEQAGDYDLVGGIEGTPEEPFPLPPAERRPRTALPVLGHAMPRTWQ